VDVVNTTVYSAVIAFFQFSLFLEFWTRRRTEFGWMCCLSSDLEDLDFFDLEILRTRENDVSVQSGLVDVRDAKVSFIAGVPVAIIANNHVTSKDWTPFGITLVCVLLLLGPQRKPPRRDAVRILQREKKTFLTAICFPDVVIASALPVPHPRFPLHRREPSELVPFRVQNHSQSVCAAVASVVKFFRFETIAAAPPQNFETLPPELREDLRKARNDLRFERRSGGAAERAAAAERAGLAAETESGQTERKQTAVRRLPPQGAQSPWRAV
jgi:hypothetical protein